MFDWALDEDTLYSNSDISNLESGKFLQYAVTNLECIVEDPGLLLSAEYDCFGRTVDSLQTDPIRLALTTVEPDEKMKGVVQLTAEAFLAIRRQAQDYLDAEKGVLYKLPPEIFILGTNAPADNMTAESKLELADYLKLKSPNASEMHIAAKVGFANNGTSDWLEKIYNSTM